MKLYNGLYLFPFKFTSRNVRRVCPSGFESVRSLVCLENSRHFLKTEASGDLVARVFPRFKQFSCFYCAISVDRGVFPLSWLAGVIISFLVWKHSMEVRLVVICQLKEDTLGLLKRVSSLHSSLWSSWVLTEGNSRGLLVYFVMSGHSWGFERYPNSNRD